ncbi:hypothetical protein ACS3SW_09745 [Roseobacteraceae bacterium S113]
MIRDDASLLACEERRGLCERFRAVVLNKVTQKPDKIAREFSPPNAPVLYIDADTPFYEGLDVYRRARINPQL